MLMRTTKPQVAVIVGSYAVIRSTASSPVRFPRLALPGSRQNSFASTTCRSTIRITRCLPAVARFKNEIVAADGVLIVTPQHNRSIPTVLKNALDWGTRPYGNNSWADKAGFIIGTAPRALGTALAQQHLTALGMILLGG
jgi:chromate reductase, NAD(P)H dehydrogenase (quinone)